MPVMDTPEFRRNIVVNPINGMSLLITIGGIYLLGLLALTVVFCRAPAGFEDETGFHPDREQHH